LVGRRGLYNQWDIKRTDEDEKSIVIEKRGNYL